MSLDILVLLGSQNDEAGNLSESARLRCGFCADWAARLASSVILPTGGFGNHFNTTATPHWRYLARELERLGVRPERIVGGGESGNTLEDAHVARALIEARFPRRRPTVRIITNRFHARRASFVFGRVFGSDIAHEVLAAPDPENDPRLPDYRIHEERAIVRLQDQPGLFEESRLALVLRGTIGSRPGGVTE